MIIAMQLFSSYCVLWGHVTVVLPLHTKSLVIKGGVTNVNVLNNRGTLFIKNSIRDARTPQPREIFLIP